jgi:hypothetical protein
MKSAPALIARFLIFCRLPFWFPLNKIFFLQQPRNHILPNEKNNNVCIPRLSKTSHYPCRGSFDWLCCIYQGRRRILCHFRVRLLRDHKVELGNRTVEGLSWLESTGTRNGVALDLSEDFTRSRSCFLQPRSLLEAGKLLRSGPATEQFPRVEPA